MYTVKVWMRDERKVARASAESRTESGLNELKSRTESVESAQARASRAEQTGA